MEANILVVEDDEGLARFIELELMHEGYQVVRTDNGRDALSIALEKDFELILLDIMLPGLNGLEVMRRLGQEKSTPVILLTARDAVMDKVAGLDAGAVDYITKPFAIEELLARIRVALKLHGKTVQVPIEEETGRCTCLEGFDPVRKKAPGSLCRRRNCSDQSGISDAENTFGKSGYCSVQRYFAGTGMWF